MTSKRATWVIHHTIVEALGPFVSNIGHDLLDLGVKGHTLNVNVCETEHRHSRGVVAAPGLESDEAVRLLAQ